LAAEEKKLKISLKKPKTYFIVIEPIETSKSFILCFKKTSVQKKYKIRYKFRFQVAE
jgi:hypothetical protein